MITNDQHHNSTTRQRITGFDSETRQILSEQPNFLRVLQFELESVQNSLSLQGPGL